MSGVSGSSRLDRGGCADEGTAAGRRCRIHSRVPAAPPSSVSISSAARAGEDGARAGGSGVPGSAQASSSAVARACSRTRLSCASAWGRLVRSACSKAARASSTRPWRASSTPRLTSGSGRPGCSRTSCSNRRIASPSWRRCASSSACMKRCCSGVDAGAAAAAGPPARPAANASMSRPWAGRRGASKAVGGIPRRGAASSAGWIMSGLCIVRRDRSPPAGVPVPGECLAGGAILAARSTSRGPFATLLPTASRHRISADR